MEGDDITRVEFKFPKSRGFDFQRRLRNKTVRYFYLTIEIVAVNEKLKQGGKLFLFELFAQS